MQVRRSDPPRTRRRSKQTCLITLGVVEFDSARQDTRMNTDCWEGVGEAPVKSSTAGIWRKGCKCADKGGSVGIIILLHFQKAFEKLFESLLHFVKELSCHKIGR